MLDKIFIDVEKSTGVPPAYILIGLVFVSALALFSFFGINLIRFDNVLIFI